MNRFNIVVLGVSDMKKSFDFYTGLGFHCPEGFNEGLTRFSTPGGLAIEIIKPDFITRDFQRKVHPTKEGFGGAILVCALKSEAEVDETIALARSLGAEILQEPKMMDWGGYNAFFFDPDGHYLELVYYPPFKFDEKDMLVL